LPILSQCQLLGTPVAPVFAQAGAVSGALRLLEGLLILCAAAAWLSRLPYIVRRGRIGRVLLTIPDRTAPHITGVSGLVLIAAGLWLASGKAGSGPSTLAPYLGLGMILLGVTLGLNFLFPTQIGSAGILDSYGRLARWNHIESYTWSPEGDVLELRVPRSLLFQRRFLSIPGHLRKDVAAYLTHRLWGAEEKPLPW
jgi:hypothetical protein